MNWQPIETAPTETPYLIFADEPYWVTHLDVSPDGTILRWWCDGGAISRGHATHWMRVELPK